MSRRSYSSFAQDKRLSKYRVTDEELFKCVLRLLPAILLTVWVTAMRCVYRE